MPAAARLSGSHVQNDAQRNDVYDSLDAVLPAPLPVPCDAGEFLFSLGRARALVKALVTAAPVPLDAPTPLPNCPRDGEGRATPLRGDVILAVQMSVRADAAWHRAHNFGTISTEWYQPFAHGAAPPPTSAG